MTTSPRPARPEEVMAGREVTVYTQANCPYCVSAKALLGRKGVAFEEIDVEGREDLRIWLEGATGQRTVPQILVGERSLGGISDLAALDHGGAVDAGLRCED